MFVRHRDLEERTTGTDLAFLQGSVMAFVEDQDKSTRAMFQEQHQERDGEGTTAEFQGGDVFSLQQKRGLRIPYSPGGKRGSLTTSALSPPAHSAGGARRQSSLKSDLRL